MFGWRGTSGYLGDESESVTRTSNESGVFPPQYRVLFGNNAGSERGTSVKYIGMRERGTTGHFLFLIFNFYFFGLLHRSVSAGRSGRYVFPRMYKESLLYSTKVRQSLEVRERVRDNPRHVHLVFFSALKLHPPTLPM